MVQFNKTTGHTLLVLGIALDAPAGLALVGLYQYRSKSTSPFEGYQGMIFWERGPTRA